MKANKNKVRVLKFFSASLALVMLLASLPTVIFAESTSLGSMSADSNASLSGSGAFLEDESMRDKFSKHYVLEDGSRFAVVFPEAVHYDDGNEWKEVDNRLIKVIPEHNLLVIKGSVPGHNGSIVIIEK